MSEKKQRKPRRTRDQILRDRIKRIEKAQEINRRNIGKIQNQPTLKSYVKARNNPLTRNDSLNKLRQGMKQQYHKFYMGAGAKLQEAVNKQLSKVKDLNWNKKSYRQQYYQRQINQNKHDIRKHQLERKLLQVQDKLASYYEQKQQRYANREHNKWVKATSGRKKYELSQKAKLDRFYNKLPEKTKALQEKLYERQFKEEYKKEYGFDVGKTDKIYEKGLGNKLSDKSVELVKGILDKIRNQLGDNDDLNEISKFMDNDDYFEGLTKKQITKLEVYEEKVNIRQDVLNELNAMYNEFKMDPTVQNNSKYLEGVNNTMNILVNEYKLSDNQIVTQAKVSKQWLSEITNKINKYKNRKVYILGYDKLWGAK